ncbi:MAG: FAD-dependent monooxygenase [Pseudomonadota bacterium]|nr:FAD-dependent monooxygenase [Pseudomonadota bacterium]
MPLDSAPDTSHFATMSAKQYDVAIVGGGMVGLSLALALNSAGVAVSVIEKDNLREMAAATFDGRGTAIAAGSRRILEGIGLWAALADEAEPIFEIRVADGASPLFLHYDHLDVGKGPLGWIVENAHMRRALSSAATAAQLMVFEQTSLVNTSHASGKISLTLSDEKTVDARLVVAADGRQSSLRDMVGIETVQWLYPQTGIVCAVEHEVPHQGIAHEHFLKAGPFAILPMTQNRSSIVWTERTDAAASILKMDDIAFGTALHDRFGDFLGDIRVCTHRWSYPLSAVHAKSYVAPRVALVGDAAHGIHPIAGQGFNLGLRDVAALAEIIVDQLRLGVDPGDAAALNRYENWRKPDNMMMIAATDLLNRLFSNDVAPLRMARDAGLAIVNELGPFKRLLMRHAMGLVGDLPRLARGEPL